MIRIITNEFNAPLSYKNKELYFKRNNFLTTTQTCEILGESNIIQTGTNNTSIIGNSNTVKSKGSIIVGNRNVITHDNCFIIGDDYESKADGDVFINREINQENKYFITENKTYKIRLTAEDLEDLDTVPFLISATDLGVTIDKSISPSKITVLVNNNGENLVIDSPIKMTGVKSFDDFGITWFSLSETFLRAAPKIAFSLKATENLVLLSDDVVITTTDKIKDIDEDGYIDIIFEYQLKTLKDIS